MYKKVIGILLALVLAVSVLPGFLPTAGAESCYLWMGGELVTTDRTSGDGWSYDPASHTLTLNGYTFIDDFSNINDNSLWGICYSDDVPLTIVLEGDNVIQAGDFYSGSAGIFVGNTDITIRGTGSLTVSGGYATIGSFGIYNSFHNTLTIESGTIWATSGFNEVNPYGTKTYSAGICSGNVIIKGGNVTAIGGDCPEYASYGIYGNDSIVVSGGTVYAEGKRYGTFNLDYVDGDLTAVGPDQAVIQMMRTVKPGTGWTNTEGTEGETQIPVHDAQWWRVDYHLERIQFSAATPIPKPDPADPLEGDILPGDVNADGVVDGRDVIRLMEYLADETDPETGLAYAIHEDNADVDGSGAVDEKDLLRMVRYMGGEDVELVEGNMSGNG